MRLIDADRFYINYARRFSREPLKVELFKQFIDAEPTVCDIEQIKAEMYHECCMKYQKTCEIYLKAFKQMRSEVEELKDGFIDNTKIINAVLDIIDKYTK